MKHPFPIWISVLFLSLVAFPSISQGQQLAVKGKTPANPTFIASIPQTKAFWQECNSSLFGKALVDFIEKSAPLSPENKERFDQVQSRVKMSFYPAEKLFTETLVGIDFYMVEHPEYSNFLINIAFNSSNAGDLILTQIKREAAFAYGISGGVSADTVVESTTEGFRTLSLPAFSLFLASDGNIVTISNDKATLNSALVNKGQALFQSQYFNKYMIPLEGTQGEFWCFGELGKITPILENLSQAQTEEKTSNISPMGGIIDFHEKGLSAAIFQNQEGMSSAERRYTLSSPPPGDISFYNFVSQDSVFSFGTNHFDGLSILDLILEETGKTPSGQIAGKQIELYLDQSRLLLGFDLKDDLLANVGPNLGISLVGIEQVSLMGMTIPLPDFLLSLQIKDLDKFQPIMEMLEGMLEQALMPKKTPLSPNPTSTEAVAASNSGASTPEASSSPLRKENYGGEEVVYFDLEGQKVSSPAICLTKTGYFLFSTSKEQLVQAIDIYSGGGVPMVKVDAFQKVRGQLPENLNSLSIIDLQGIASVLGPLIPILTTEENAAQMTLLNGIIETLKQGEMIGASTQHLQSGRRIDIEVQSK